ncbi:MAG: hypothetical protein ACXVCY_02475 [Pseudobdellovibrionaceae bacterium]
MNSQRTIWSNKKMKALLMIGGAAITMGNQKCQQKPQTTTERSLKKIVELGAIRSSSITFPGGTSFDFQFVANQQIYGVLAQSKEFKLKYNPPIAAPPATVTNNDNFFNLTKADTHMMKVFAKAVGKDNYNAQYATTAWCMVNLAQAKISGAINSFEMIGGGGINIGFTPAGALPGAGLNSLGINVDFAQLDLSMYATRPLTSTILAASNIDSTQTKTKVNFALTFGAFTVGPSAYYQTPLAKVTETGLRKGVDALDVDLKKDEWYTRILANHDTHLIIVGGADVNLEPGDQLLVYNEEYYWEGEPCNSKYLGGGAQAGSAVAKIEIDWVGDEISRGRVIEQSDFNAVVGAKVKLFKFHDPNFKPQDPGVEPVTPANPGAPSNPAANSPVSAKPGRG